MDTEGSSNTKVPVLPWMRNPVDTEGNINTKVPVLPWMRNPVDVDLFDDCPLPLVPFLDPRLEEALRKMGIESLFPVQVAVWQETIGPGDFDRDICVNSPTGSGKTLAYALPIVQVLSTRMVKCLRALIVLPTRDLALQVKDVFAAIAPAVGLTVGLAVGQSSIADEISQLIKRPKLELGAFFDPEDHWMEPRSSVDILVATPGRLMEHINMTKCFNLDYLRYLVVDETDRLLREAYQSWLPTVLQLVSSSKQKMFCEIRRGLLPTVSGVERGCHGINYPRLMKMIMSATLTQDPSKLSQLYLHHPILMASGPTRYKLPSTLDAYQLVCEEKLKSLYLLVLLHCLKGEKCIVFTSSVELTHNLCTLLNLVDDLPFKIKEYSSLQRQSVRSKVLKAFRKGKVEVLVSSDAMARGMDINGIKTVINYDMPPYIKTYVHRAGRTARAGQTGRCFTFLRKDQVEPFTEILQKADTCCRYYTLPPELIDNHYPSYLSAMEKLKKLEASGAVRKRKGKPGFKSLNKHRTVKRG